jgi:hypothetical protein
MRHLLLPALALLLCIGRPALAAEPAEAEEPLEAPADKEASKASGAERFASSSVLVEHSFSVAHGLDLSPEYTRTIQRTLLLAPSFDAGRNVSLAVELGISQELTVTDTTYPYELMLDDLKLGFAATLPERRGRLLSLAASTGMDLSFPTSKASLASSLITGFEPWIELALSAPLLDGLQLSYRLTPNPRIHRYSTASMRVPRPCSRAAGCSLGTTTNTGERNTALQLHQDIGLGLSALDSKASISAQLTLSYGLPYALSPSERYDESILSDPANKGGSPVSLSSAFVFDISYQVHPGVGLSLGLWTPGGMRPDGSWYNPLANRNSQVYLDITIYPVALVQAVLADRVGSEAAADEPAAGTQ